MSLNSHGHMTFDHKKPIYTQLFWAAGGWSVSNYFVYQTIDEAKVDLIEILKHRDSHESKAEIIPPPTHY